MDKNNVTKTVAERVAELLNKAYSEPKLLFHTGGTEMFLKDGKLPEESDESLEQVITRYVEGSDTFHKLICKMHEASQPYLRKKWKTGKWSDTSTTTNGNGRTATNVGGMPWPNKTASMLWI